MLDPGNDGRNVIVPVPFLLAQELVNFLAKQPYNQVAGLIRALTECMPVEGESFRNRPSKQPDPVISPPINDASAQTPAKPQAKKGKR